MKFIHASDFHLCSCFRASSLPSDIASAHRDQLWHTFYDIIAACKQEQIDLLLISGDLFEHDYAKLSDVKRISDAFAEIPETKVMIVCGNHDPLYERSYYKILEFPQNVFIFPSEFTSFEIPQFNAVIHGFSWNRNKYEMLPFIFSPPDKTKTNLLLLHCDVLNKSQYLPIELSALESLSYDYIALGHIHKSMQVRNQIFYSGSPEPLDFGEEGKHGYFIGEMQQTKLTVKFVRAAKRQFLTVKLTLNASMNNTDLKSLILSSCNDNPKKNLYRIYFSGTMNTEIDLKHVMNELSAQFYCLLWEDQTIPDYDIDLLNEQNRDNLIGKYIQALHSDAKKNVIAEKALRLGINALMDQNGGQS